MLAIELNPEHYVIPVSVDGSDIHAAPPCYRRFGFSIGDRPADYGSAAGEPDGSPAESVFTNAFNPLLGLK